MKSGKCPKCGSATIYTKHNGMSFGDGGVHVSTDMISIATPLDHYICTTCGFFEAYLTDPAKLEAVATRWTKVG